MTAIPPRLAAQPATLATHQQLLHEIFQELVEIDTTHSTGDTTVAAEAMARATAAVCVGAPVDGARSPPRGSGVPCPARSDRIGARCHGSSAL